MNTNYHTHTQHCGHAGGLPEDYAKAAISHNIKILGISDHAAFPDYDYGFRMSFSEIQQYFNEIDSAKEQFKDQLKILKSMEIEYLPKYTSYYEKLYSEYKVDYLLLGEHFFEDSYGKMHNITNIPDTKLVVEYAKVCVKAMETGYFRILAHPDLFCINEPYPWNDDYEQATDIIIEGAIKTGTLLEYNANGLRRGIKSYPDGERFQYPHLNFWKKVSNSGLPAIVGSDCHNPINIWDNAVEDSIKNLSELNIKRIELLNFDGE